MRLDQFLSEQKLVKSRDRAKEMIKKVGVFVNGKLIKKPAFLVKAEDQIELLEADFEYVSRAGLKLEAALKAFAFDVKNLIAIDIGVATGGFSQCLLKYGAKKVYGVDIGEGQISQELLEYDNFIFLNQTDGRNLNTAMFAEKIDLIVVDVSFISIKGFLPSLADFVKNGADLIILIKPQFELEQNYSGIIKSKKLLQEILAKLRVEFAKFDLKVEKEIASPVKGKAGNQEFLWKIV